MLNMTKGFHKLGHEVYLLCLNTSKHYVKPEDIPPVFKQITGFTSININTDIRPVGAALNLVFTRKSYHISRFYSKNFEVALIGILKSNEFDVVQIEGLHMCLYIDIIRKHTNAKIALRAHNLEYLIWDRLADNERNPLKRFYLDILTKRLLKFEIHAIKKVDYVIPITAIDADVFREIDSNAPIFVSPTGLDLDTYVIDKSKREWPGIFHLGALNWMPNIQAIEWFLKEIWPIIHTQFPKVKFYVAGRNMPEWLRKLDKVGVQAIGEVDNAIDFMNSKSIMVVPLLSGSGMRIKIIEGMAMGKIIVSTSIGAEGIDYQEDENIIIADKAEDFASSIIKCINNPEFAKRIGNRAALTARNLYSDTVLVEKLVAFYNNQNKQAIIS